MSDTLTLPDIGDPVLLEINEIFGPTYQGEGPYAGQICAFIRLAQCNQQCAWCDTAQTWAFTQLKARRHRDMRRYDKAVEVHVMNPGQICNEVKSLMPAPGIVVLSGGEPMLQQWSLRTVVRRLFADGYRIHVETAGTIMPDLAFDAYVEHYSVSVKLMNSGNPVRIRYRALVVDWFVQNWPRAVFKFVVTDLDDFNEIDELVKRHHIRPGRVMVMPEGITPATILRGARALAPSALQRGYGLSLRTHTLIWGNERRH